MMKIGFDAKRYFRNITGLGNYSRTLIRNLVRFHPEHRYLLYTYSCPDQYLTASRTGDAGYEIRLPQTRWGRLNGSLWRTFLLPGDLARDNPDIYHGLSHEIPYRLNLKSNTRIVVTIHDLIFMRFPQFYHRAERQLYLKKFRYACHNAHRIIAISEQTKQDIVEFFQIPEQKIQTIYQSCDPLFQQKASLNCRTRLKQKYNLPEQFVLYVGSFTERKNVLTLVKAVSHLKSRLDTPLVLLGGGGEYKKQIETVIHQQGLADRVQILSGVPNDDLPGIYQMSALFVYPSIYEGFGIPIIEAMMSRVPVITSKGGCFAEAGGPDSLYVDPTDVEGLSNAMEKVLTDKELASKMITSAIRHIRKFSQKETADQLIQLYKNLIA